MFGLSICRVSCHCWEPSTNRRVHSFWGRYSPIGHMVWYVVANIDSDPSPGFGEDDSLFSPWIQWDIHHGGIYRELYRFHVSFFGGFLKKLHDSTDGLLKPNQALALCCEPPGSSPNSERKISLPPGHLENFDASHGHWGDQKPGSSGRMVENPWVKFSPSWWILVVFTVVFTVIPSPQC